MRNNLKFSKFPLNFITGLISGVILIGIIGFGLLSSDSLKLNSGTASLLNKQSNESTCPLPEILENTEEACAAYLKFKAVKSSLVPSGVPAIYGEELDISFDQVQDAINKVRVFGPTYGQEGKKITFTGADLERYINIGSQTACKYCCGAKTLVRRDGQAACGCAHSIMMRGLAAYLIKNHPELSDDQILEELNTWRITYFPKQTLTEKLTEMEKAGEPGIKELLEEFPEFMPQMVGGC
ncbi:hypothetical protein LCGC14_0196880 [marine sediment metagenome]|uniref:Uncharacterized protein n=1 Tax=marine sediment metagenome TaxID=412755 RepID=A0A0F9UPB3_9ZZZZ|nr:hypothetical protein [Candidatus Nealsonbacteria bacterium]